MSRGTTCRRGLGMLLAALATTVSLAGAARAAGAEDAAADPVAATVALYARMSARDLPGVLRLVPADGFTELGPDAAAPHRLAPVAFEGLFRSDLAIALRAEDVEARRFGDVAVVTGTRVGAVGPAAAARQPFTMVWTREPAGDWRLRHVHLSAPAR